MLATAFRLLDLGFFRVGGEEYAEANGSFGLATIRKEHVRVAGEEIVFEYPAKSGQQRLVAVADDAVRDAVLALRRRRGDGELLAHREGRRWRDVSSDDINVYVKDVVGGEVSAKDFRTWHGTVLAAVALAERVDTAGSSTTRRTRAVRQAMTEVADVPRQHAGRHPARRTSTRGSWTSSTPGRPSLPRSIGWRPRLFPATWLTSASSAPSCDCCARDQAGLGPAGGGYRWPEWPNGARGGRTMLTRDRAVVVDTDVDTLEEVHVTESHTRFAPAQFVHAAIGVFLLVLGVVSMVRGDLSGDLTEPTFDVISITHNAAIGIGEVVAGALLLLAATGPSGRFLGVIVGLALVAVGAVMLGDEATMQDLGTESAMAWLAIGLGAVATLVGLIPSRLVRRRRVDRSAVV